MCHISITRPQRLQVVWQLQKLQKYRNKETQLLQLKLDRKCAHSQRGNEAVGPAFHEIFLSLGKHSVWQVRLKSNAK